MTFFATLRQTATPLCLSAYIHVLQPLPQNTVAKCRKLRRKRRFFYARAAHGFLDGHIEKASQVSRASQIGGEHTDQG
jgi:hypothetical protein